MSTEIRRVAYSLSNKEGRLIGGSLKEEGRLIGEKEEGRLLAPKKGGSLTPQKKGGSLNGVVGDKEGRLIGGSLNGPAITLVTCPRPNRVPCRDVESAIIELLDNAQALGLFTSTATPTWSGWITATSVAWHLPERFTSLAYQEADHDDDEDSVFAHIGTVMQGLADRGHLERRTCLIYPHCPSPDIASLQDIQYRRPGFCGYCYWDSRTPDRLGEEWESLVNHRHLEVLQANLDSTGSTVPPFVLALIESRLHNQTKKRRVLLY